MKYISLIFILFTYLSIDMYGQVFTPASSQINKSWVDKNGENNLQIKIKAVYNPLDENAPRDGHPTKIEAKLENSKYKSTVVYDDKDYQMEVIMFDEDAIWLHEINGFQAVFIPFFYCCMDNTYTKVSYIILYNKKKYLYHFRFLCDEDKGYAAYLIDEDKDLNQKLKRMPNELREVLIKYIGSKYKTGADVFPRAVIEEKMGYIEPDYE